MTAYVITIVTFFAGFLKRKSKVISVLMVVALWVLMGLNSLNADYASYEYTYNGTTIYAGAGQTIGYWFLAGIAKGFGLDFFTFRAICCAVGLLNIYAFISRYTKSVAYVMALYLVCPFFYDIVQFRFFFASSFAVFGMRFLIEGEGKNKLLYAVFVAVASLIHPACALFVFFYIVCLPEGKALTVSVVLSIVSVLATYTGIAAAIGFLVMDSVKAELYLTTMGRFGFIPYWASILLSVAMVLGIKPEKRYNNNRDSNFPAGEGSCPADLRAAKFNDFSRKAVLVFLPLGALLPLSVQNFYRVIRSVLVLVYIHYTNSAFGVEKKNISKRDSQLLFLIFWAWFILTAYVLFHGVWDQVVVVELENNLLWS